MEEIPELNRKLCTCSYMFTLYHQNAKQSLTLFFSMFICLSPSLPPPSLVFLSNPFHISVSSNLVTLPCHCIPHFSSQILSPYLLGIFLNYHKHLLHFNTITQNLFHWNYSTPCHIRISWNQRTSLQITIWALVQNILPSSIITEDFYISCGIYYVIFRKVFCKVRDHVFCDGKMKTCMLIAFQSSKAM
jgi:hypothetical protein